MGIIKEFIHSTSLYSGYKINKKAKLNKKWNSEDDKRLAFYAEFLGPGDICFDIGANIGNRSKIFLRLVEDGGLVVAVEPQEYCCKVLKKSFSQRQNFDLVNKALGAVQGEAEMLISDETTVSSMSTEWVAQAKKNHRFGAETKWQTTAVVSVTTIDSLIELYGEPRFVKIDVEGYEKEVIFGLSKSINTCFSLEFVPEFLDSTFACLNHLAKLGTLECNYSLGEIMALSLDRWISVQEMQEILGGYADKNDFSLFGDVYVRLNP